MVLLNGPETLFLILVLYIGTTLLFSMWSILKPCLIRECSNVNEQPIAKATRLSLHKSAILLTNLKSFPFE